MLPERLIVQSTCFPAMDNLHSLSLATGEKKDAPILGTAAPYGQNPYGLNLLNNVIYTITGQGCAGKSECLYLINLTTKKVTISKSAAGWALGSRSGRQGGRNDLLNRAMTTMRRRDSSTENFEAFTFARRLLIERIPALPRITSDPRRDLVERNSSRLYL